VCFVRSTDVKGKEETMDNEKKPDLLKDMEDADKIRPELSFDTRKKDGKITQVDVRVKPYRIAILYPENGMVSIDDAKDALECMFAHMKRRLAIKVDPEAHITRIKDDIEIHLAEIQDLLNEI
jgi:hypothetical protein